MDDCQDCGHCCGRREGLSDGFVRQRCVLQILNVMGESKNNLSCIRKLSNNQEVIRRAHSNHNGHVLTLRAFAPVSRSSNSHEALNPTKSTMKDAFKFTIPSVDLPHPHPLLNNLFQQRTHPPQPSSPPAPPPSPPFLPRRRS